MNCPSKQVFEWSMRYFASKKNHLKIGHPNLSNTILLPIANNQFDSFDATNCMKKLPLSVSCHHYLIIEHQTSLRISNDITKISFLLYQPKLAMLQLVCITSLKPNNLGVLLPEYYIASDWLFLLADALTNAQLGIKLRNDNAKLWTWIITMRKTLL